MSNETRPSPGPWRWWNLCEAQPDDRGEFGAFADRLEGVDRETILWSPEDTVHFRSMADAALIADAWRIPTITDRLGRAMDILRKHQWRGGGCFVGLDACPECQRREEEGHGPVCKLAALLAEVDP